MEIPETFDFTGERRVEWADTDCAGIAHFTSFLRYVESVEHEFWRSLGRSVHVVDGEDRHGWPRLSVHCDYFKPVTFETILTVGLRIEKVGNTTIRYRFWITEASETDGGVVAVGELTIIHVAMEPESGKIQKAPIPQDLRSQLDAL